MALLLAAADSNSQGSLTELQLMPLPLVGREVKGFEAAVALGCWRQSLLRWDYSKSVGEDGETFEAVMESD